jgi:tetratricopeptide (TPR) repeat protein
MEDDTLASAAWTIDPATRLALRLEAIDRLMRQQRFDDATVELEELLDEEPDETDALFLLGECALETFEPEVAQEAYRKHLRFTRGRGAQALLGLAISSFELADPQQCLENAREALRQDPGLAEGHYYAGLASELLGLSDAAARHLISAAQLDRERYPPPRPIDERHLLRCADRARRMLDPELQRFWRGVPVQVEEWPNLQVLRAQDPPVSPLVRGMVNGAPPDEVDPWVVRPPSLKLYRSALSRLPNDEAIIAGIAEVFEQEALHWLGEPSPD